MTKHKLKDTLTVIGIWTLIIVALLFVVIIIGLTIYAFVKYGGKPITEIPSWALWFMFRGNK